MVLETIGRQDKTLSCRRGMFISVNCGNAYLAMSSFCLTCLCKLCKIYNDQIMRKVS